MAIRKTVKVGEKEIAFAASAATAIKYQELFDSDLFYDLSNIEKGHNTAVISRLAYVMAVQASPNEKKAFEEWLDDFEPLDLMTASPEIMAVWSGNTSTKVEAKKNQDKRPVK